MSNDQDTLKGKLILGIDLGTTKSVVTIWDERVGRVVPLEDKQGRSVLPSMVGWDRERGQWVVGHAAKELAQRHPDDVIYSIKRYIGREFHDPNVLNGHKDLTYTLVSGGGKDKLNDIVADLGLHDGQPIQLKAPQVSAMVLGELRRIAAERLDLPVEEVKYAVITVPAYFNMLQRQATILAGKLAGLEVVDILNEPTAAALAYGDIALSEQERRILVYDLGGGTFDISLLRTKRDDLGYVFYTRVVDGHTRLGGDDIDTSVARWLEAEIQSRYHHPVRPDDQITRARLRVAAEEAKVALSQSSTEVYRIDLPALDLGRGKPFDAQLEISQAQLNECAADVVRRARAITRRAVEEVAELKWSEIDEIILVGGQTLMPAIQRDVEDLTKRTPRVDKERARLAVALGAGEYAHILSLGMERFQENSLINVLALPVGVRLDDDTFERLVEANVTVPHTSRPFRVTTIRDNDTAIQVDILQGPRNATSAAECITLETITMEDLPPEPAGVPQFDIVFDVKSNGTMTVMVTDVRRRRKATKEIVETRLIWTDESSAIGGDDDASG